jgi:3-isopropylmalate/(R)-2-methylmalate dehydratase large subunit
MSGTTLFDKLWDSHVVTALPGGDDLLYVDRHLLQEVSTHQSFEALYEAGRAVRRPEAGLAVADHAVPTSARDLPIADPLARAQIERLEANAARNHIPYLPLRGPDQGIVHVIGPEQGFTLPGALLVCGDSHTSTHGAFGALAFGIGASECGVVLATQCTRQHRSRTMRVTIEGALSPFVSAKDVALAFIARIGAGGGTGHAIEFCGSTVRGFDMSARMTLCNMAIESGARIGLIAPDETTFAYLAGRPMAPADRDWDQALTYWRTLSSDADALFARTETIAANRIAPHVTWGTSPQDALPIDACVPEPANDRTARSLAYMGLTPGVPLEDVAIDRAFIGSCTNGRIEDLRAAAGVAAGRRVAPNVRALVVPGSTQVKAQAEREGLDRIFRDAGFEWREAGCSMCVAMNDDRLSPGERCASTSNRNFEGRQGRGGRTHLMSPAMAAAAAVTGHLVDVRTLAAR